MTTFCSERADIEWLTGSEADVLLTELAENSAPLHTSIAQLRKRFSPSQTHLLAEQVELRRRAAAKFTHPEILFFTRLGLEQATDEWVARYKAARFQQPRTGASPIIADLCCGIGADLMALANCGKALGIDRDPVAAHFARVNSQVDVRCIDVADFDFDGIDAWHIDPDRRPTGRRTTSLEWCQPNRNEIERLLARLPHAAIKLAPATAVPDDWAERCELEWISRDRECRQQIAWHGDLATDPGRRRATILLSRTVPIFPRVLGTMGLSTSATCAPRTITGQPNQPITLVTKPDRFVFDVDPAVIAARLTGALAAEHRLSALGAGPTYLTGPQAIDDTALACFEVDDVLPLRVRPLAQHLRARDIGQLEIKKRGVDLDLEKLRRNLKLHGDKAATLLTTQIAGRPIAVLARRVCT